MEKNLLISGPISVEMEHFRAALRSSLHSDNPLLTHVVSHILQKSGKMMRPMLTLLSAKLLGEVNPATHHAAISLELLHNASLVHDDVVDESDQRRGQVSVNALFNNKVAVLSGDYLLATSLVQVAATHHLEIIALVARLGQDLADGELLQLVNVSNDTFSDEIYYRVIKKKTAVLFAACTQAGALSVDASAEDVERMRLFGEYIGICFQIRDDIFDYYVNEEIGKPTGNDMKEGKLTLPVLYALNSTRDEVAVSWAIKVKHGTASEEEIAQLVEFTKQHRGVEYAEQTMEQWKAKAIELLSVYPDGEVKTALLAYLDCVIKRSR